MDIKQDNFIIELLNTLNNIAKDKGSKYSFEIASDIIKVGTRKYYHIALLYTNPASKEKAVFINEKYQISKKFTEEDIVEVFKQSLLKHIIFMKDYMTEHMQRRSMKTLLSKPKIEKKLFNKFENYLTEGEGYYEEELQDESGRYYLREK